MVYCEARPESVVMRELDGAQSIIMVGCAGCANTSVYLQHAPEGSAMMTLTPTGFHPVAMQNAMENLERDLSKKGWRVETFLGKYPTGLLCMPDKRGRTKIVKRCQGYDAIVTLCCDGGTRSMQNIMGGKKVIPAMQASGLIAAVMKSNLFFTKISLDKDSVDIVKFMPAN